MGCEHRSNVSWQITFCSKPTKPHKTNKAFNQTFLPTSSLPWNEPTQSLTKACAITRNRTRLNTKYIYAYIIYKIENRSSPEKLTAHEGCILSLYNVHRFEINSKGQASNIYVCIVCSYVQGFPRYSISAGPNDIALFLPATKGAHTQDSEGFRRCTAAQYFSIEGHSNCTGAICNWAIVSQSHETSVKATCTLESLQELWTRQVPSCHSLRPMPKLGPEDLSMQPPQEELCRAAVIKRTKELVATL